MTPGGSAGTVDADKAPGPRSTVLLDHLFNAGSAFEAGGTPTAVLVDGGKVVSRWPPALPAVLALPVAGL